MATFGYTTVATGPQQSIMDEILSTVHTCPYNATANSITVYLIVWDESNANVKCAIYDNDNNKIAETEERLLTGDDNWRWETFNFTGTVNLVAGTQYHLAVWADDVSGAGGEVKIVYDNGTGKSSYYDTTTYNGWPEPLGPSLWSADRSISIYCTYTPKGVTWFDKSYPYRKKVIVNGSMISGNHTDFPVLITTYDADISSAAHSGGKDILMTTQDGTRLPCEQEYFISGSGNIWFKAPSLIDEESAIFYLYYGGKQDKTNDIGFRASGVWDDKYIYVNHMEDYSISSLTDSTKWNNRPYKRFDNKPYELSGMVGASQFFTSAQATFVSSQYIPAYDISSMVTFEFWINEVGTSNAYGYIINRGITSQYKPYTIYANGGGGVTSRIRMHLQTEADVNTFITPTYDRYRDHYIVITYQSGAGDAPNYGQGKGYLNGELGTTVNNYWIGDVIQASNPLNLGNRENLVRSFSGQIDEVRISKDVKTLGYVLTNYRCMSSNSNYIYLGAQESRPLELSGTGKLLFTGGTKQLQFISR